MADRTFTLKFLADVTNAVKGVDDIQNKTQTMKDKMVGIGKGIATGLAAAAVVDFGKDCINAAADADDAMDAVASAFGTSSKEIENFSKTAADKMGLSAQDYQKMAAETGRILTGFGISNSDAAKSTESLSTRAADMAAIVGGTTEDAMAAIDKALQGQTKGLKQYGISISKAEVDARAMAKGYVDASGKVTDAGRAIATQELILEKTSKYQGEFAKNSGDLGSQQDILKAKFENLQTTIGTMLLPILLKVFDVIKPFINFMQQNMGWIVPLVAGILAIVAAIKIWNAIQLILNAELLANPIVLVVAAIAALVAGLIWAYNNVEWFRNAVDAMASAVVGAFNWIKDIVVGVFNWIKDNWPLLIAILTGPIGVAVALIVNNWDTIKNAVLTVFNWIKEHWPLLLAIITGPFGLAVLAIQRNWDTIKSAAQTAISAVTNALVNVAHIIAAPFQQGAELAKTAWNGLINLINGAWNAINNAMHGISDVLTYPFRKAVDAIKYLWNSTVGGFGITIPSWVPKYGGNEFRIPKMAAGGIVTRPTVALIGEAGPEAVVPLGRSGFGNVTINVYALTASAEVGKQVYNALREYERTTGKMPA